MTFCTKLLLIAFLIPGFAFATTVLKEDNQATNFPSYGEQEVNTPVLEETKPSISLKQKASKPEVTTVSPGLKQKPSKSKETSSSSRHESKSPIPDVMLIEGDPIDEHLSEVVRNLETGLLPSDVEAYHPERDAYHTGALTYLGGTPIIASQFYGLRSDYDGSSLVVNFSTINEYVRLLEQRMHLENVLLKQGDPLPARPVIDLSGAVEVEANYVSPFVGNDSGDFNLRRAQLDIGGLVNSWISALMVFDYDDSATFSHRVANSRTFLSRGFITVGNLRTSPWYVSGGQFFVPFGRYSSFMLNSVLAKKIGRIKARSVVLGYDPTGTGFYGSVYGFNGDASGGNSSAAGGVDAAYRFDTHGYTGEVGVSFVSNIAESDGMQITGTPIVLVPAVGKTSFGGFGITGATNVLGTRVPGLDVHGKVNVGSFSVIAEYVGATKDFAFGDLSFNGSAAKPSAYNIEVGYHFFVWDHRPITIAGGFQHTNESFGLGVPEDRYSAAATLVVMPDVLVGLEFEHDKQYPVGTTATGALGCPLASSVVATLGQSSNKVTFIVASYF